MIRYRLSCGQEHEFDGWFRDSAAFDLQSRSKDILCPHCGDCDVEKVLMTPGLLSASKRNKREQEPKEADREKGNVAALSGPMKERHHTEMMLSLMREHVERNFEYLGEAFPEEARRINRGDAKARNIYGEASPKEVRELGEEGIDVYPLPNKPNHMMN